MLGITIRANCVDGSITRYYVADVVIDLQKNYSFMLLGTILLHLLL